MTPDSKTLEQIQAENTFLKKQLQGLLTALAKAQDIASTAQGLHMELLEELIRRDGGE